MAEFRIEDRMVQSLEDVKVQTKVILSEMNTIYQDRQVRKLFPETDVEVIKNWSKLIEKSMDEKLTVVVAGDFKRGKSSLINALIGTKTATVNVSPETVTINKIAYREEPGAEAVLVNGKRLKLYEDELSREKLEKIIADAPAEIDYIEIYRNNPFLQHITLVDTPGLGDGSQSFEEKVTDYLVHADIVIYVISALSPLSAEEQAFLNAAVLPQNLSKMFLVVNMADTLDSKEDIERIKNEIVKRTLVFNHNASVYAISALDAYCAKNDLKRPNPELSEYLEQSYESFEEALVTDCIMQKQLIKADRIATLERNMVADIRARIKRITDMVSMDEQKLLDMEQHLQEEQINVGLQVEHAQKKSDEAIEEMKREARVWMHEFMERLRLEISRLSASMDGYQIQKYLQFYISDKTKEAFQACLQVHGDRLQKLMKEQMDAYNGEVLFSGDEQFSTIRVSLTDISWSGIDTAAFFINRYVSALGVVGYAIAGFAKQKKIREGQKDLITPLLENFSELVADIEKQIEEIYGSYKTNVREKLEESYRHSIEEAMENVLHAKEMKSKQDVANEQVVECLEFMESTLNKVEEMI